MKIPSNINIYDMYVVPSASQISQTWIDAAIQIGLQHGVYVSVVELDNTNGKVSEVVFKVGDHTFGSLTELKRAIRNKAFL
jgi:hypothetical protein